MLTAHLAPSVLLPLKSPTKTHCRADGCYFVSGDIWSTLVISVSQPIVCAAAALGWVLLWCVLFIFKFSCALGRSCLRAVLEWNLYDCSQSQSSVGQGRRGHGWDFLCSPVLSHHERGPAGCEDVVRYFALFQGCDSVWNPTSENRSNTDLTLLVPYTAAIKLLPSRKDGVFLLT